MSPEQSMGSNVDHRTDIWSLGILMYEMVTGRRPFISDYETALVYSILNEDFEPVTGLRTGVPLELEKIIHKCLEKDPADRYQHTDDIIVDLRKVEKTVSTGRSSKTGQIKQALPNDRTSVTAFRESDKTTSVGLNENNTSRPVILLALAALILLIASAAFIYLFNSSSVTESKQIKLSQLTFSAGIDEYPVWSPDGKQLAFSREDDGYRNIFIKNLETGNERQVTHTASDNIHPAWSPDGSQLLFVRANQPQGKIGLSDIYGWFSGGDVWKLDLDTMIENKIIDNAYNPTYSPDGKWIAIDASWAGPRRLWLVDERGRNPRQLSSDISEAVVHTNPEWSPDGMKIAFQHIEGTKRDIRMLDRSTEEVVWITDDFFLNVQPCWSATGYEIFFSSYRGGGLNIWRAKLDEKSNQRDQFEQITTGAGPDLNISVSPDGESIAFSVMGINSDLWFFPASSETGLPEEEPRPLIETTREDSRGAWSPDGRSIAFISDRTGDMNIWLYTFEDEVVRQLTSGPGGDYQPKWSPDGKQIAFFSSRAGHLDIWTVDIDTGILKQLTNRPASDINPFYSPDGLYIAFQSDQEGRLEPWTMLSDGTQMKRIASMDVGIHFMLWNETGTELIVRTSSVNPPGLWSIPVSGGEPYFFLKPAGGAHISFSPDNSLIMDVVDHRVLWVTPIDGGNPVKIFEFDDPEIRIDYPSWSPDGNYVIFDHYRPSGGNIWLLNGF
jgi:eukaryotic-like serine/threonine-protein kinase